MSSGVGYALCIWCICRICRIRRLYLVYCLGLNLRTFQTLPPLKLPSSSAHQLLPASPSSPVYMVTWLHVYLLFLSTVTLSHIQSRLTALTAEMQPARFV